WTRTGGAGRPPVLAARGRSLAGRVGSATAPDPGRHDDGIAMSYVEECQRRGHPRRKAWVGAVAPQPTGREGGAAPYGVMAPPRFYDTASGPLPCPVPARPSRATHQTSATGG